MKWVNHIAIAAASCAVLNPVLVPVAVAGSTAPDWMEWVLKACGRRVGHRTVTHYVVYWLLGIAFGFTIYDYHNVIKAFSFGGLSHVFADSLTLMGVPLGWWSDRKYHLFGGRLRTGQMGEYWVTGFIVLLCVGVGLATKSFTHDSFAPFFYDWAKYYQVGEVDGFEWKENRFRWL
jgi:inner membrane protein